MNNPESKRVPLCQPWATTVITCALIMAVTYPFVCDFTAVCDQCKLRAETAESQLKIACAEREHADGRPIIAESKISDNDVWPFLDKSKVQALKDEGDIPFLRYQADDGAERDLYLMRTPDTDELKVVTFKRRNFESSDSSAK